MEIKMILSTERKPKPGDLKKVPFGTVYTDHMFVMDYTKENGWFDARIIPYGPLALSPAATVLQYATQVFEGMKAYRTKEGTIQLFRPYENARRLNVSAERMCLPQLDEELFVEACKALVSLEKDWVPAEEQASLYLRPFIMGIDADLALHGCNHCQFVIIASPVGSYYPEGINPVRIMIEKDDVRAVRGGTGFAKCGGNYAAALRASERAAAQGYSQVLWLDGVERKYIEEVGGMNVMFILNGEVVTPTLTGSVLPGITRKSCIDLFKSWGMKVHERLITVDELIAAIRDGSLEEAWCCGTAAVVSPIGELAYDGEAHVIGGGRIGSHTQKLYDTLTGIQWGNIPDPFGWICSVE